MPSPGYRVSGKEVEVRDSGSRHHQLCGCCNLQLIQSHVAPSHGPPARTLSPLFFLAKSLLLPKPRGKKKHSKTTWSSLLSFRTAWSFSPLQNHMDLYLSTCFRASWFSHLLQSRVVYSFLQSRMVSSPFTLEPRGLLFSPPKPCGPPYYFGAAWSLPYFRAAWSLPFLWLPGLGLNPSAHLPLQPHF